MNSLQNTGFKWLVLLVCLSFLTACTSSTTKKRDFDPSLASDRYVELGLNYMQMGKLNEALENLEKAIEADGDNIHAHNSIAVFYERIRKPELARYHFEESLDLYDEDPTALNNYGRFLCNSGDIEEGIAQLQKAADLPLNERPWFALTNIGNCEFLRANNQAAEPYYRQALIDNPAYPPALLGMAEITYEQSKYMKTRAFIERFLSYRKANAKVLLLGFLAENALGQDDKAEEYKDQLIKLFPISEEATKLAEMEAQMPQEKSIPSSYIGAVPAPQISPELESDYDDYDPEPIIAPAPTIKLEVPEQDIPVESEPLMDNEVESQPAVSVEPVPAPGVVSVPATDIPTETTEVAPDESKGEAILPDPEPVLQSDLLPVTDPAVTVDEDALQPIHETGEPLRPIHELKTGAEQDND